MIKTLKHLAWILKVDLKEIDNIILNIDKLEDKENKSVEQVNGLLRHKESVSNINYGIRDARK